MAKTYAHHTIRPPHYKLEVINARSEPFAVLPSVASKTKSHLEDQDHWNMPSVSVGRFTHCWRRSFRLAVEPEETVYDDVNELKHCHHTGANKQSHGATDVSCGETRALGINGDIT